MASAAPPPAATPLVTSYSVDEVHADVTSWTAVQDASGVLYFGAHGLLSFDGSRWRAFPAGSGRTLRSLEMEGNDRIWAAANGDFGWFQRLPAGWAFHSLKKWVPPEHSAIGETWHVFRNEKDAVFVTDSRILRWNGQAIQVWPKPGGRRLRGFRAGGTVFIQAHEEGLYAMRDDGPELVVPQTAIGSAAIFLLEATPTGWFAVTDKGLGTISPTGIEFVSGPASDFLQNAGPISAIRLRDGRIAVTTVTRGIGFIRNDGSMEQILSVAQGLPSVQINGLFPGRGGEYWAMSFDHISRIDLASPTALFAAKDGVPAKPFNRMIVHRGEVWGATNDGAFRLNAEGTRFEPFAALGERIMELRSSPGGLLAAGSRAVKRVDGESAAPIFQTRLDAFATLPLGPGEFLVSEGRRVSRVAGGQATVVAQDLPDLASSLALDGQGRLWMGTSGRGILVYNTSPAAPGPTPAGLPQPAPSVGRGVVRTGPHGEVLAFSSAGGWIVRPGANRAESIPHYPQRALLAASEATAEGDVWLLFEGAGPIPALVGRVSTQAGQVGWAPHAVDGFERIGSPQAICAQEADGGGTVLWISGSRSVLRHAVTGGPFAPRPSAPLLMALTRATASDDLRQLADSGSLPFATDAVIFDLIAPDYAHRAMARIEARIEGVDREWTPVGENSRYALPKLRDGTYTIHTRVVAETGQTSDERKFTFTVLAPWWRSAPALASYLVALAVAGWGFNTMRVRALRRRNAELEQKVRKRTEELEEANAAKTRFVADMSHNMRNPLNGAMGMALALEDTRLDPKQREIVATLRECMTYLSSLTDDVLDFASIEAGKVELRPGPFVPGELLRSIVMTLQGDTAESGARLTVDVAPDVPGRLMGDTGRIQQILVNYVSNALKYAGGHIRLSAALRPNAPGEMEFSVRDNGPGIDPAEQAALFTKFTRLKGARESDIPGSGLGLASCRLLADIMGGAVGVVSKPGEGARFFLRLPVTAATETAETPLAAIPNTTVLLVEDTDYNAWAAQAVLSRLGLTCERARTGREAIQLFREKRFNLVLLDRNLPDMDGLDVAREMRAGESGDLQAVLLAVTAYATAEDRKLCLDAGMDAFVGKPLTPEKLRRVLLAMSRKLVTTRHVEVADDLPATEPDLAMLSFLAADADDLETQLERFEQMLEEAGQTLAQGAAARDFAAVAQAAHFILGQARMVKGASLAEAARRLETAAKAREEATVEELRRRVARESAALMAALRLRRPSVPSA